MLARILEDASATQILKGVDVLLVIWWLQESWNKVTNLNIKNCFKKCGIKGYNELMKVEEDDDLKFTALVKEFTADISAAEYVSFNKNIPASELMINEFEINWQQQVREDSINAIQNPEIASDQVEKILDDDRSNDKNDELEQEIMGLTITMLDKMKRCPVFDNDSQDVVLDHKKD